MIPLLAGTRILELSAVVMGPFAGQILADLGAEVIKVEPIDGDVARASQPQGKDMPGGMGALYVNNNRNKRALAVDLKSDNGKAIIGKLLRRSDVLLHNMRPDAADRLGLSFDAVAAINPRLIYCSAIGFGQRGRYRGRPAFDDVIQAAAGLAGIAEHNGEDPRFIPTILADKVGALHAVYGILAALVARANGRQDALRVEVPMFEALTSFVLNEHLAGATFQQDGKVGYSRVLSRDRRPYRTRDGWIAVLPYTGEQWRRFLIEAGREDVLNLPWFHQADGRQANIDYLYSVIASVLPQRSSASWLESLSRLDIPCSQVNRLDDLLQDPHLHDVGFFHVSEHYPPGIKRMLPQPVVFGGVTAEADIPPPTLGADTWDVLSECGYSTAEIDDMLTQGIARGPARS
ncbi:CoA transferase [Steroidobacter sp. S1-65]|uniref:CoA transferase n=1 Tax=Steroidobacter gossypii TaxID=2805490 RepID=A0ABS1WTH2_9GAMM|nr:CoA transferase [Steroidobacter gossypii]MBM0104277.1 CoA transferase [Steroidobacter gossypii]